MLLSIMKWKVGSTGKHFLWTSSDQLAQGSSCMAGFQEPYIVVF